MGIHIKDKKFLKYLKDTVLDFKAAGGIDELEGLKDILKRKYLDLGNITFLLPYVCRPSIIEAYLEQGIPLPIGNINDQKQLLKEHRYMRKYLLKYFTYEEFEYGICSISYK